MSGYNELNRRARKLIDQVADGIDLGVGLSSNENMPKESELEHKERQESVVYGLLFFVIAVTVLVYIFCRCQKGENRKMFGGLKKNKHAVVVTTKEELEAAVKRKEPYIEVRGELVKKIKWMQRLSSANKALLLATLASVAIPNPVSAVTASAIAGIAGKEVVGYFLTGAISVALVAGVLKGYDVEIEMGDFKADLRAK